MDSKDEEIISDTFDVPSAEFDLTSPLPEDRHDSCHRYLRETIAEPLSNALAFVVYRRPDDAIEFIANFLIDWSRQKPIDQTMVKEVKVHDEDQRESQMVFEYDKHVLVSNQWDVHIDPRTDDEREPASLLQPEEQVHVRSPSRIRPLHTHDTASGSDGQQPFSLPYFTRLKNQIRQCHDT